MTRAYLFLGFLAERRRFYDRLHDDGYEIIFRPVVRDRAGAVKGNIDADLVLQVMIDWNRYQRAVLVSSDGDFFSVVQYLSQNGKLAAVISPHRRWCSRLLRIAAAGKLGYLHQLRSKLQSPRGSDGTT